MLFSLQLPLPLALIRAHLFEIELIIFFFYLIIDDVGELQIRREAVQMQPPEVFYKKSVLKNHANFTGKHLC